MARITMEIVNLPDVATAAPNVAQPLSLTSVLVPAVVLQFDSANAAAIHIGSSTVSAVSGLELSNAYPVMKLKAEDSYADEDQIYVDLADIYIISTQAGQIVKLAYTRIKSVDYN